MDYARHRMPWPRSPKLAGARRRARASCTTSCRTAGCAATRAATAVRCPTARSASARCASTRAARCACRGATSAACSAIRSRRSRSSTRYPGALAYSFGMLGCDLHCGYCQNWVTSQALRDPAAVAPPLATSPEALVRDALRLGRARHRQHLQRAAHHQRVGGRGLQGGEGRRADAPASCRTATARRRCSSTCGRGSISTRSISRASTTATTASSAAGSSRSSTRSAGCTRWASGSRSSRCSFPGFNDSRDELDAADGVRRRRLARHPVARHRVSRRLQDDGPGEHDGRRCCSTAADDRPRARACATSTPATCPGAVGDLEDTRCAACGETARRAVRLPHPRLPAHAGRPLPVVRDAGARPLGPAVRRADRVAAVPARLARPRLSLRQMS